MRKLVMSRVGLSVIAICLASTSSFGQGAGSQGAAEVQVLPNGNVMIVNLEGTLEFCLDERDRGCAESSGNPPGGSCSCRIIENSCDFIVANRETGEISNPEPISQEAVDFYGGSGAFPIIKEKSEDLLDKFKFGENECNMKAAAMAPGGEDNNPPFTPPGCTRCVEPTSPQ